MSMGRTRRDMTQARNGALLATCLLLCLAGPAFCLVTHVDPCSFLVQGTYNVTVITDLGTKAKGEPTTSTTAATEQGGKAISASFSVAYSAVCGAEGVAEYTMVVQDILDCGQPGLDCYTTCVWNLLAAVSTTFTVSPSGSLDAGSLKVSAISTGQVLLEAGQQQLIDSTCVAAEGQHVMTPSELNELLAVLAAQAETRYESISEELIVPGTKESSDDGGGLVSSDVPYLFNTETKVTKTSSGGHLASQSKYLVPSDETTNALDGNHGPDVGAGEVVRAYYSVQGVLLARSRCTTMEIVIPTGGSEGGGDSGSSGQAMVSHTCITAAKLLGAKRRRANSVDGTTSDDEDEGVDEAQVLLAEQAVGADFPDLDEIYPGQEGYGAYLANHNTDLKTRHRARRLSRDLARDQEVNKRRELQAVDANGFLAASDDDTYSLTKYTGKTQWEKTFYDSGDAGFTTLAGSSKTGVRAQIKATVNIQNASASMSDINVFVLARFSATLDGSFLGAEGGLAGYHFIAQANYQKTKSVAGTNKNKVLFRQYLNFPFINVKAFDDSTTIPLGSSSLGDVSKRDSAAFKKLGSSKTLTFFVIKVQIVPVILTATFKLTGTMSLSASATLADALAGKPILGIGGSIDGVFTGTGSADAGLTGIATASVTASIDFINPIVTTSGGWAIEDLLTMSNIGPTCTNQNLVVKGLGIEIGWNYKTFLGISNSGVFWTLAARTLMENSTGWVCDKTTQSVPLISADGTDTPVSLLPAACSAALSIPATQAAGFITSDPSQQSLTSVLPLKAGNPALWLKPYLQSKTCSWTITVPAGSSFVLKSSLVDLESSDSLVVTYPAVGSNGRRLLADATQTIGASPYSATPAATTLDTSAGGTVTVTFKSDDTIQKSGFVLLYEVNPLGAAGTPPPSPQAQTFTVATSFLLQGVTVATFTPAMQDDFKNAIATVAGVLTSQVNLVRILASSRRSRGLLAAGVSVDSEITGLPSQGVATLVSQSIYSDGAISPSLVDIMKSTTSLAAITPSVTATPVVSGSDLGSSGSKNNMMAITVGAAVGGGVAVLVVVVILIVAVSRGSARKSSGKVAPADGDQAAAPAATTPATAPTTTAPTRPAEAEPPLSSSEM